MRRTLWALFGAILGVQACAAMASGVTNIRHGLVWKETINITVDQCSNEGTPIQDNASVGYAEQDDGGSFTDEATDINDAGANDVAVFPATPAVDDAFYVGADSKFSRVKWTIGTAGSTVMTVTWEYYDSSGSWSALTWEQQSVVDFDETAGTYENIHEVPGNWVMTAVDGQVAYWIRARVSAYTSVTTQALVTQAWLGLTSSGQGNQVVIRADTDETEDLWCNAGEDSVAVDDGFVIDAGTGALTTEVGQRGARDIWCCGDGGTVDIGVKVLGLPE